eukprot:COSAG04_NODE_19237_length_421_cov_0.782609_1_plen_24_part_10
MYRSAKVQGHPLEASCDHWGRTAT